MRAGVKGGKSATKYRSGELLVKAAGSGMKGVLLLNERRNNRNKDSRKTNLQRPAVDAWVVCWPLHGVCFATSGLAIGKDAHVVAVSTAAHHRGHLLKHLHHSGCGVEWVDAEVLHMLMALDGLTTPPSCAHGHCVCHPHVQADSPPHCTTHLLLAGVGSKHCIKLKLPLPCSADIVDDKQALERHADATIAAAAGCAATVEFAG